MLKKLINNWLFKANTAAIIMIFFAACPSYAESLNLKKLHFGISQEKLKSDFKIDELDVATTGESTIRVNAQTINKDLPEQAVVEFSLLDDKFVQIRIINENKSSELLKYAGKIFGDMDNKPGNPRKLKSDEKTKRGLWAKGEDYSVLYETHTEGKHDYEKLMITSRKHHELFSKVLNERKQADADYQKQHGKEEIKDE